MLYDQFGDKQPIIKHYPSMKKWMRYMKDKYMVDHIMTKDNFWRLVYASRISRTDPL